MVLRQAQDERAFDAVIQTLRFTVQTFYQTITEGESLPALNFRRTRMA